MLTKTSSLCQRLLTVMLLMLMVFSLFPVQAFADNGDEWAFELTGDFNGQFDLSSRDVEIFNLEDMVPGDSYEGKIKVKNNTKGKMEISIISIVSNLTDNLLYDTLELQIKQGDNVIYDGSYGETSKPISDKYIVPVGKTLTFDIVVSLPFAAGNEIANKEMDSSWTFEANHYGEDKPGGGGGGGSSDDDDGGDDSSYLYPYTVNYIDDKGNKLHESKTGWAEYGEKVTENALTISGYEVDKAEKSIIMKYSDNVIDFIYQKPNPSTGHDLTTGNTGSGIWIVLAGVSMLSMVILMLRIKESKQDSESK